MKPNQFPLSFRCFHKMLLILGVLLTASVLTASAPGSSNQLPQDLSTLEQQIRQWASELAKQEPFSEWKDADLDIQALGPGTHSWLTVLRSNGETVGYMVVHAAEDGTYRLGEYGTGPDILFSENAMRRSLMENGIIESKNAQISAVRYYFHPFAAVWEVQIGEDTYWLDGKTSEWLPIDSENWNNLLPVLLAHHERYPLASGTVSQTLFLSETFDPYQNLPWLTGEKPYAVHNAKKAQHRILSGLHLRYVAEPFGDAALYALPVTGFHSWENGRLDLALDMSGPRFIPLETLQRYGHFYE